MTILSPPLARTDTPLSAHDLEQLVCERLAAFLADGRLLHDLVGDGSAGMLSRALRSGTAHQKIAILAAIIDRIFLHEERIDLLVDRARLCATLDIAAEPVAEEPLILSLPVVRVRRGHQLRLIIPGPDVVTPAKRDEKLMALVAEAHAARRLLLGNAGQSLSAIAAAHGRCRTRLGKLIALSCMAPAIVTAIVEGRQPASLTARALLKTDLPLAWADQRRALGFA